MRYFGAHRAAREQVLGAVNLGCFAQDGGTAVSHQQVHRCAQCRVGTDAGVTVGAAALQADGDVRSAAGLALDGVSARQHLLNECNAFVHRLARAAAVLDVEDAKVLAFFERAVRQPGIDLVGLAAQADHQHASKVDVGGVAGQSALQNFHAQAITVHAAAGAVCQRHHAVHVGKVFERSRVGAARKMVGNGARCGSRAIDAGQNADVIARGYAAVGALDAHELCFELGRRRLDIGTNGVVARKVALVRPHVEVVRVHMLAGGDGLAGKTNDLVVAAHRLAGGQCACGHLMAGRYEAAHGDVFNLCAAHQLGSGNQHVIGGVKANKRCHGAISIKHFGQPQNQAGHIGDDDQAAEQGK